MTARPGPAQVLTDHELEHWREWNWRKRNEKGPITAQELRLLDMQLSICDELIRRRREQGTKP